MKRKSFHLILRDPTVYSLTVRLQHLYPSFMLHPSTRTCKHCTLCFNYYSLVCRWRWLQQLLMQYFTTYSTHHTA